MNILFDGIAVVLTVAGVAFFISGTVGLLRFPDVYSRLHALTKCDNLGLGFIVIGVMLRASSVTLAIKMLAAWVLVLIASATAAHLIARRARLSGAALNTGKEE